VAALAVTERDNAVKAVVKEVMVENEAKNNKLMGVIEYLH
jgi:hypothetical protein